MFWESFKYLTDYFLIFIWWCLIILLLIKFLKNVIFTIMYYNLGWLFRHFAGEVKFSWTLVVLFIIPHFLWDRIFMPNIIYTWVENTNSVIQINESPVYSLESIFSLHRTSFKRVGQFHWLGTKFSLNNWQRVFIYGTADVLKVSEWKSYHILT